MQEHVLESMDPRVLGRRLQEARKARGLTQQEVASSLSMARTTVTALEKGERRIRPEELIAMARLYGRSVSDLVGPREPTAEFSVQFRTAATPMKASPAERGLDVAIQEFQRLCEDYFYLEQLNNVPAGRAYPNEYPFDGIDPEEAAEDVAAAERNRLGLGDGPIPNLREILENDIGLRVFYIDLPSRVAGVFAHTERLGGCIAINVGHPEERRRWSMAHEFGHFLTQRYRPEISILAVYDRMPASERFADSFARCFLMPSTGLRRRFNEISRLSAGKITAVEVCRVADFYFVSVEAMMLRLEELRLLPGGAWERLRDRGFRVREAQKQLGLPPRDRADQPLPLRYRYLAVRALQEEKITEGQLARLLRVDRAEARHMVRALTNFPHVLGKGDVRNLSVDLAGGVSRQAS